MKFTMDISVACPEIVGHGRLMLVYVHIMAALYGVTMGPSN